MTTISKSHLLATSAIASLAMLNLAPAAQAQEAFGVHNDQPELLEVTVEEGETVEGDDIGVYGDNGPIEVDNAGTIRGNGTTRGDEQTRPSAGVVIAQAGSSVDNSGTISGAAGGVVTAYFFSEDENGDELPPEALAADTTVTNSGTISGEMGAGVALIGGGTVTNSGTITGTGGLDSQGVVVAEFPDRTDPDATGVGAIDNAASGIIRGGQFGAVLSGGGTVDNAGLIESLNQAPPPAPNVGLAVNGTTEQEGRIADVNNTGTIRGLIGMTATGSMAEVNLQNDGLIGGQSAGVGVVGVLEGTLSIVNSEGAEISGQGLGVISSMGALEVDNAGLIQGTGQHGINILTADAVITNSGAISGGLSGIITNATAPGPDGIPGAFVAYNATVTNTGTITGTNNDGIRLAGGGTVTNSGTITGVSSANNPSLTDGVSIFNQADQDRDSYVANVTNSEAGEISGASRGVIISGGGTVDNAGNITGGDIGVLVQNGNVDDEGAPLGGYTATVVNTQTIVGMGQAGLIVGSGLETSEVTNTNFIYGNAGDGVVVDTMVDGVTTIDNGEFGDIVGTSSGVEVRRGSLELTNAGTIVGQGRSDGTFDVPDGGVSLAGSSSAITNGGEIRGAQFGIVTYSSYDPATGAFVGTITDTTIDNSGTITGENDDGIRLAGGGTITNSGTIQGLVQNQYGGTDGVSIFSHNDQDLEGYSGTLINEEGGVVSGLRAGAALSSGGTVINAGTITGEGQGVFIQGNALDGVEREGQNAALENSGTITGTGNFGGTYQGGYAVSFGSNLDTATLVNSGTIASDFAEGVSQGSLADLTITNQEGGVIEGGTSGIYGGSSGTMTIANAGTIRGNGAYDGFDASPDAGITIGTADSSVTNSGTISGAGAGVTTAYVFNEELGDIVGIAINTQITNSGTILGEANDGVRLIGGGTVTNSGTIRGEGSALSDGVSIYPFEQQSLEGYVSTVTNAEDGEISGTRFGVILSGGGTVENAGTITGEGPGGVLIQRGAGLVDETGHDGTLVNSGTITGTTGYGAVILVTDTLTLDNSGTITGATSGAVIEGLSVSEDIEQTGSLTNSGTITGSATYGAALAGFLDTAELANSGTIEGGAWGVVLGNFGEGTLVNTGTITGGELGVWGDDSGPTTVDNAGTIASESGVAVQLGSFDDSVILRTGSAIDGAVDAGAGVDSLTLAGEVLELTEEQELGMSLGFESLAVASGYWNTSGVVGEFGTVSIDEGAALQVNEVDLGEGEGLSSPILTTAVTTNGLLVLNFSENDVVSALDDTLAIDGTGGLQLIGEAVFTVDTDTLTYTGGTTISDGGLVLTGTLTGDVVTEGDGYFELGAGGTEGTFSGDIVNDGRFVFNRSDDYDFLGAFSGSGALDKLGDGTLTFMGDYAFQGVTNIMGGAVRIGGMINPETDFNLGGGGTLDITGTDQTIGGLEGEEEATVELGEQTLTVEQEEDTQFAGAITGLGGIVKDGEGILNLTGDSTYTGPTDINGGTLAVNGSIVSPVTVNAGGTLGGNGSLGDTTVGDDGTLAPGNSIGRLTVNGDLAFAAGAIYEVEVNAAGEADRVDATGEVTIDETASVAVMAEEGDYALRTDYVILTGAEGVSGTFGSVTTDLAFLDPLLRYAEDAVTLSLYRNDVDFADVAANANQAGAAAAVQSLGIDDPLFEAVVAQNEASAQATFGDLSGEILASTISGLTDDSRHLRNAIMGMAAPSQAGMFVWGSAFGGWGSFDGSAGNFGMDADHKGLVAGIGVGGEGFGAALSGGIGGSDFDLDGRSDSADVESKYLAAHATAGAPGGFHGAVGISYAWHEIETGRAVGAPLAQTLTSNRDAGTLQVFGEAGYDLAAGSAAITPFVRLAHVSSESDAFAEAGGIAALTVAKADQDTTFLSLGARARFNAGGEGFQPYLSAAWNRAFGDRAAQIGARFASGPVFAVTGNPIPKNSAEVEAGFEYTAGAFSIGGAYSGTLAGDRTSHGARVTARVSF